MTPADEPTRPTMPRSTWTAASAAMARRPCTAGPHSTGGAWRSWPGPTRFGGLHEPGVRPRGRYLGRPRREAAVPPADGGLAGPGPGGQRVRLRQSSPSRSSRPSRSPRRTLVPGQAALLRHRPLRSAATPTGVLWSRATSGRPTKIEGNPGHPASLRRPPTPSCRPRSSRLYDPDRSQGSSLQQRAGQHLGRFPRGRRSPGFSEAHKPADGARGLGLLTEVTTSPTMVDADGERAEASSSRSAKWYQPDELRRPRRRPRRGDRWRSARTSEPIHHLDRADVILGARRRLHGGRPGPLRDARAFAEATATSASPPRARTASTSSGTPGRPRPRTRPARR